MPETTDQIAELTKRLDNLVRTQIDFQQEVSQIRSELGRLRAIQARTASAPLQNDPTPVEPAYKAPPVSAPPPPQTAGPGKPHDNQYYPGPGFGSAPPPRSGGSARGDAATASARSDLEKFIGENLLSKIGILILVLGVAIGAKYAIDNGWISPMMRIILGYVFGFGLIGLAIRLKPKYHNFSAVLLSGGMAIMYFITYFAYSIYQLLGQSSAFALMLIFTVFAVAAAINYSRQIIAHLGLVGAYATPFLLSDNSGNYAFLFTYMAILNGGILAISLRKYWKPLFYTSFVFTWAIFTGWHFTKYSPEAHFGLGLLFLLIFFAIFYVIFLGYKLLSNENVAIENIALVLANSFVFFGLGYAMIYGQAEYRSYLGLFTVANAAFHLAAALTVCRMQKMPSDIIYLLAALVLTFVTITVPVQFNGKVVTLAWSAEAVILFSIGRLKRLPLFEYYSYPLIALATASMAFDWALIYAARELSGSADMRPFFNGTFVTGLFYTAAIAVIYFVNRDEQYEPAVAFNTRPVIKHVAACAGTLAFYNVFRMEIGNYFYREIIQADAEAPLTDFRTSNFYQVSIFQDLNILWQINYTLLFLSVMAFVNIGKIRSLVFSMVNIGLLLFVIAIFTTASLYLLGEVRNLFLGQSLDVLFSGVGLVRYLSMAFLAAAVYAVYRYSKLDAFPGYVREINLPMWFDCFFYFLLWIVLSSELVNWIAIFNFTDSYKLGLSILWGVYALVLVGIGIYQGKKYLRIGAIGLFAFTLAKIFLYDIADLDTISKTVVFVSLGILILIVAFLYNKYTALIFKPVAKPTGEGSEYEST